MIANGSGTSTFMASPTYSFWFRHYMTGCHRRMGDTWIPDQVMTMEEVLHYYMILEEDWVCYVDDPTKRLETMLTAMLLIGGFSGGLRGEELPKIELGAI
jgi:hypothetical protein